MYDEEDSLEVSTISDEEGGDIEVKEGVKECTEVQIAAISAGFLPNQRNWKATSTNPPATIATATNCVSTEVYEDNLSTYIPTQGVKCKFEK